MQGSIDTFCVCFWKTKVMRSVSSPTRCKTGSCRVEGGRVLRWRGTRVQRWGTRGTVKVAGSRRCSHNATFCSSFSTFLLFALGALLPSSVSSCSNNVASGWSPKTTETRATINAGAHGHVRTTHSHPKSSWVSQAVNSLYEKMLRSSSFVKRACDRGERSDLQRRAAKYGVRGGTLRASPAMRLASMMALERPSLATCRWNIFSGAELESAHSHAEERKVQGKEGYLRSSQSWQQADRQTRVSVRHDIRMAISNQKTRERMYEAKR